MAAMSSFRTLARGQALKSMRLRYGARSIAPPIKAGVWSGCVSARTADVKEWIHICNSCWFGLPTPVWSLALIGNASGRLWGRAESRSEAFSMRRLGGSRWRLRRTRCAMGFERQLVAESKTGRELANWNGGLVIVEGMAGAGRGERAAGRGNVSR